MDVAQEIHQRLTVLKPELCDLDDDSAAHQGHAGAAGGGGHYTLTIVSAAFVGKNRVARHRQVYDLLQDLMPHTIHALALKTYAPGEI